MGKITTGLSGHGQGVNGQLGPACISRSIPQRKRSLLRPHEPCKGAIGDFDIEDEEHRIATDEQIMQIFNRVDANRHEFHRFEPRTIAEKCLQEAGVIWDYLYADDEIPI